MNILLLAEGFYPKIGGGALGQYRFAQLAVEEGHEVVVYTPRKSDWPRRETVAGVKIRRPYTTYPSTVAPNSLRGIAGRVKFIPLLAKHLLRWCRTHEVDAIISSSHLMHPIASVLRASYDVPMGNFVGYTPSLYENINLTDPMYALEQVNFNLCMGDFVFCRTPVVQRALNAATDAPVEIIHGILNSEEITCAAETADVERIRDELRIAEDEHLLAFVGQFTPVKNITALVRILSELPPEYTLVIVGDGPERDAIERQVQAHDLDNCVKLVGKQPHDRALEIVAASDALVLTSNVEAYPTVVFEGLAFDKHVFATPVGILPELTHPRVHLGNVSEMAGLIERTDLQHTTAAALDTEILNRYSMQRYTTDMLETLERLVE